MTEMDRERFYDRVMELAVARGKTPADDQIASLFRLLDDLPWLDVERGLAHSARHDTWFPDPVRIRKAVAVTAGERARVTASPEAMAAIAAGEVRCHVCHDTGWEPLEIAVAPEDGPTLQPWMVENLSRPDRAALVAQYGAGPYPMYPHGQQKTSTRACACRATNPLYRAKRAAERRIGGGAE